MAFFRATIGNGGGGQMVETVLWTNNNPSPATGFAAQAAPLSDDINNYDFICVEYARVYSALSDKAKVYWKVSDYKSFRNASGICGAITLHNQHRNFYYDNDTQAHFAHNYVVNGTQTVNQFNIPLCIYGCKVS
ncbi:MAG: hypothetical protein K5886_02850 [Lachnospiraceae bacterium]|nr:hypothetical protein [Lachnospiraceae bacterium]